MSISIERAVETDVEDLVRIQIAAFHYDSVLYPQVELGGPPGYDSIEETLKKMQQHDFYKFVYQGKCVGGMVVWTMADRHYHLDLIFIAPDFQNRGIGTQAMQFLERTYPATRWTLDTPTWAVRNRHFYEKLGYVNVREYEDDGFPLIGYEKWVAHD